MNQHPLLIEVLAQALLGGEQTPEAAAGRGKRALGSNWKWLPRLAQRYVAKFAGRVRPRLIEVIDFLRQDRGLANVYRLHRMHIENWIPEAPLMQPAKPWPVPSITTPGDLAHHFSLLPSELDWFADLRQYQLRQANPRLDHYHYRVLSKPGSLRLIEAPKRRMKALQRRILDDILVHVPPHDAAHGFVPGRSIKTFSAPHVGQSAVLRMDLRDFFPSIGRARVQALFRTIGYPESVADLLGGICTTATPKRAWTNVTAERDRLHEARMLYRAPHLPQGAPTSPAIANLIAFHLDSRLTGLATASGATYTRYADDLAFSGGDTFLRSAERFSTHVAMILDEEGFSVNHRKTRIMRRGVRQYLAGVVVNDHLNIVRHDFDTLKAVLTNCARHGPASQNRTGHPNFRMHLEGRISFVEMIHPARGAKLRAIFQSIPWDHVA
ncbi:MAG: reverse transcriptase family protein [Bryobacteraceae bacterium]